MKTAVAFDRFETALGAMVLATDANAGAGALAGAWFDGQRHQPPVAAGWVRRRDLPVLAQAAAELAEYLAGGRSRFDVALAPAGTPFQRAVWRAIAAVPYGATLSYRELAARAGRPDAIRAAGAATGRNPLSIFVPCHRIVGADGALTGYAGGIEKKRALLALERGAALGPPARRAA